MLSLHTFIILFKNLPSFYLMSVPFKQHTAGILFSLANLVFNWRIQTFKILMKLLSALCPLTLPSVISIHYFFFFFLLCFPGGSVVKNLPSKQETWVQFLCQQDSLEEEMATHSSIVAWKIPWTEEPSGLLYIVHGVAKEGNTTQQLNNFFYQVNFCLFSFFLLSSFFS